MPVMDGDEALDRMLTIRPDIPVIVTSGREADETLRHLQGKKVAGVLQKPFTVKQLVEIMKRAR
jgi:CheY-like chemotaxis protein